MLFGDQCKVCVWSAATGRCTCASASKRHVHLPCNKLPLPRADKHSRLICKKQSRFLGAQQFSSLFSRSDLSVWISQASAELGAWPTMTWKSLFSAWTSVIHDPAQVTTVEITDMRIGHGGLCIKNGNIARSAQASRRAILSNFLSSSKRLWMLLCVWLANFSWQPLSRTKFSWVSLCCHCFNVPLVNDNWLYNPACGSGLLAKSHAIVSLQARVPHVAGPSDCPMWWGYPLRHHFRVPNFWGRRIRPSWGQE